MTIEERLKNYILSKYKSIREFTIAVDVPYSTIDNMLKRGISGTGVNTMIKICDFLALDVNDLARGRITEVVHPSIAPLSLSSQEESYIRKYRQLDTFGKQAVDAVMDIEYTRSITPIKVEKKQPMYSIRHSLYKVSAGIGFMLDDNNAWETISIPDSPEARQADFALTISGDSMEPIYYDGDVVLVEQCDALDEGEVGVYIVNGDSYIKKYGVDRLISLNEKYKDIKFSQYDTIKCVGRVIGRV